MQLSADRYATGTKEDNAKLRFVVMLCDPVSRLESAYVFFRGRCEAAHNCESDGPYKHINYAAGGAGAGV